MPDSSQLLVVGVMTGVLLLVLVVGLWVLARAFVRVDQGRALVISKPGRVDVSFIGALVLPLVHRVETIDIGTKTLVITRRGKEGIHCRDNIRADVTASFHVRVNDTADDVLKVAQTIGCSRAGDPAVLQELFVAKFSAALKTVAKHLDFEQLHAARDAFEDEVLATIGRDLSGYVLDDVVIDALEQTPLSSLDPHDILDAEGIRRITERTTQENIRRNELQQRAERELRRQQLELEELVVELQGRKADALGRYREATGRDLGESELQARIDEHLRALLRPVVEQVLGVRLGGGAASPDDPGAPAPR